MTVGVNLLRQERGMLAKLAADLGISRAAVARWQQVPAERVVDVERVTGIPREKLRPDLYRHCCCDHQAAGAPPARRRGKAA